jgi:hypothetical protein
MVECGPEVMDDFTHLNTPSLEGWLFVDVDTDADAVFASDAEPQIGSPPHSLYL